MPILINYLLANMKHLLLVFVLILSFEATSQEVWIDCDINSQTAQITPNEVLPITNKTTNEFALIFKNRKYIFGYLYDNQNRLKETISSIAIPKKADFLIGTIYKDDTYALYFSNTSKTKFSLVTINFKTKNFKTTERIVLDLKREKVVDFLVDDNEINILTTAKKSSILKTYQLNTDGYVGSQTFDLSNEKIISDKGWEYNLYDLIFGNPNYSSVKTIENGVPNALEKTSAFTKIYYKKGKLKLTNNLFNKYTYIINLNLKTASHSLDVFENDDYNEKFFGANSNSYILKDYFFNIYSNNKKLNFNVYDLSSKALIKSYEIDKDEPIAFKNTPIIQEGGEFDSYRELEKTSKFLRKISGSKIGITAYENDNTLIVTLGASEERQSNKIIIGTLIGGIGVGILLSAFDSYSTTKSTRINCLFTSDLEHISGTIPLNSFDIINNFIEEKNLEDAPLQSVFIHNDNYIWGSFSKKTGIYTLHRF